MLSPKLTSGTSSSVMLSVVSVLAPASTAPGRSPKASRTLSPSSSSVSCVAVKVSRLLGLAAGEGHAGRDPGVVGGGGAVLPAVSMGMTTVRSGSWSRVTVTSTVPPSATVYDACPNDRRHLRMSQYRHPQH